MFYTLRKKDHGNLLFQTVTFRRWAEPAPVPAERKKFTVETVNFRGMQQKQATVLPTVSRLQFQSANFHGPFPQCILLT